MFPSHSRPVTAPDPSLEPSHELRSRGTADHHAAPIRRLGCVAFLHLCAACGEAPTATEDPGREPAPPPPVTPPAPPPPNLAPSRVDTMPPLSVTVGATETIAVASYFTDPEGEPLAYSAETMNSRVATVTAGTADTLSVTGVAIGEALVWVRATDPVGGSASQPLNVTVRAPNRAPETNGTIPPQTVEVGDTLALPIARYFRDPDRDTLNYSASSSADSVVTAALSGDTLTITGVSRGTAAVTITARDPDSETATLAIPVTVRLPTLPAPFDIRVVLEDSTRFSPRMMAAIDSAVRRWERPLAETVLPDPREVSGQSKVLCDEFPRTLENEAWDAQVDVLIAIQFDSQYATPYAGQCGFSTWNDHAQGGIIHLLPDEPIDVTTFNNLITHEIGHILGIGSGHAWWGHLVEGEDPHFPGARAVAAFNAAGASDYGGAKVPIVDERCMCHWDDRGIGALKTALGSDIMSRDYRRISEISLGALADLGYTVDLALAEPRPPVPPPSPNRPPQAQGTITSLMVDVGRTFVVPMRDYFTDPDGDVLTYSASSSAEIIAVSVSGDTLTIVGVSEGTATVTVLAADPDGATAEQTVTVTVRLSDRAALQRFYEATNGPNWDQNENWLTEAPLNEWYGVGTTRGRVTALDLRENGLTGTIPGELGKVTHLQHLWLDGNALTGPIPAELGALAELRYVDLADNQLTGELPHAWTSSEILVELSFDVESVCVPRTQAFGDWLDRSINPGLRAPHWWLWCGEGTPGYRIDLVFLDGTPDWLRSAAQAAADYWMGALAETEWPDVGGRPFPYPCFHAPQDLASRGTGGVDDLVIAVGIDAAQQPVAFAAVCERIGDLPAFSGAVGINLDAPWEQWSPEIRENILRHEIAHVLGIGTWPWGEFLREGCSGRGDACERAGLDSHFAGELAIAAFDKAGGKQYRGKKVPVENSTGAWVIADGAHWRHSVVGDELMSGCCGPTSAITLQALADMGYIVDLSYAEGYTLPSADAAAAAADAPPINLSNDVLFPPERRRVP